MLLADMGDGALSCFRVSRSQNREVRFFEKFQFRGSSRSLDVDEDIDVGGEHLKVQLLDSHLNVNLPKWGGTPV